MFYTSRSAVEAYQDCPRYRYHQYFNQGKGLVPVQKSIPLVTGSAVHRGVEHLANRLRIGEVPNVDMAVEVAIEQYKKDCEAKGFSGKTVQNDRQQAFTYAEQMALTEGLIRAWALREMPQIEERYKVVAVERDIDPIEIATGVWFQAKVDIELQEKGSGDYFNYSLKTAKQWNEKTEDSYKRDLQGITEIWAVEKDAKRQEKAIDEAIAQLEYLRTTGGFPEKNAINMQEYLRKQKKGGKKVTGTRFCVLIKGQRKQPEYFANDPDALWITYSPLIRGYKRITPTSVEYAHHWFYPNPNTKSGKSALGQGWEPFNVWESNISVKQWVNAIEKGNIQPECGDVVKAQVVTPVEYFRSEKEIEEAIKEIRAQEAEIAYARIQSPYEFDADRLAEVFPHIRKHCEFHFGGQCEYVPLCWQEEVKSEPLGSGLYQIREAHHKYELEGLK